ncbi:hypothetical protein BG015_005338 [Linnemannia schmuckeri]|uniref:Uncharacterized protein n=1 Tax=Linnemannia schmuckeri TaxID=64567 RepID=A0A9P5R681_9FUNG|nr:hypothetical protein BG015_005338 [Linnemannia schmuckeri]
MSSEDVCGSTFPPECKDIFANRLYMCSGVDAKPEEKEKCKNDCIIQAGNDVCVENLDARATFPPECKDIDVNTLYKCSDADIKPDEKEKCKKGENTETPAGAKCTEATGSKCKDYGPPVKNAAYALGSVGQLLEKVIKTDGSTALVIAILSKNVKKLKVDLLLAVADAISLGTIAGPGKPFVGAASDLLDKLVNGTASAATTTLIAALRALVPTLDIKQTVSDNIKGIPGAGTIIGPIITQAENAPSTIDSALEPGSGALVGEGLGVLSGALGTITTLPLLKTALTPVTALTMLPKQPSSVKRLIDAFLDPLEKALNTVSSTAINAAVTALKAPCGALKSAVPAVGPAVNTLIGGLEMVDKCYNRDSKVACGSHSTNHQRST